MSRISVGYVRRAHGTRGDVIVRVLTDNPDRYAPGSEFLTDEPMARRLVVESVREHNDGLIVGFEGMDDRDAAEQLQGVTLTIDRSQRRELANGEYWADDLEGLSVIDTAGRRLGTVTRVVLGEAQDRIVVRTDDGSDVEVPFVEAIVGEMHPSLGHLVVDPPEGLFP